MREKVLRFTRDQYEQIQKNTEFTLQEKLYQLSMVLLTFAMLKELKSYKTVLSDMENILRVDSKESQIQESCRSWMLGRMAIASIWVEDGISKLNEITENLSVQLSKHDNQDAMTGWAFAYITAIDETLYDENRINLFEYIVNYQTNSNSNQSDNVWTLVMALYASARWGDEEDYKDILNLLRKLTGIDSLSSTVLLVPKSDYRHWLVSLIRYSFTVVQDTKGLSELVDVDRSEIKSLDDMLAVAMETLISDHSLSLTKRLVK